VGESSEGLRNFEGDAWGFGDCQKIVSGATFAEVGKRWKSSGA